MPNILQATTIYIVNILKKCTRHPTRSPSPLWHHPRTLNGTPWRTILSDHRPCKLKVLPRKSSRFHNPQSNVLQFLPYSSPANAGKMHRMAGMALCFHEDGRKPKWKFGGGWWCLICLSFFFPSGIFSCVQAPVVFKRNIYPASFKMTFAGQLHEKVFWISESFISWSSSPHKLVKIQIYHMCWDLRQKTSNFRFFALHWLRETDSSQMKIGRDP